MQLFLLAASLLVVLLLGPSKAQQAVPGPSRARPRRKLAVSHTTFLVTVKPGASSLAVVSDLNDRNIKKKSSASLKNAPAADVEGVFLHDRVAKVRMTAAQALELSGKDSVLSVEADTEVWGLWEGEEEGEAAEGGGALAEWHLDRVDQPSLPLDGSYVSHGLTGEGTRVQVQR